MEDRYEIRGKIGQGGLGGVYRAYDTRMNREVAIKRITRSTSDAELEQESTRQLMKEAGALAALQHPHIVTVYDYGSDEDGPYVVMELISGKTLDELIEVAPLTWQDFRELALQTQEALIAAQELDLIHSDLKPSNLMLTWLPSGKFQVKIVDFGLATLARSQSKEDLASLEAVFGSVFFMAPEQFERLPVDARSDMYSMGCVYYQALTGVYPFNGKTGNEVMEAHLHHLVTPLQEVRDDLPRWVCDWIMWHLNRRPEDRPESAREALSLFLQNDQNPAPTVSLGSVQPANVPKRPRLIIPGAAPAAAIPESVPAANPIPVHAAAVKPIQPISPQAEFTAVALPSQGGDLDSLSESGGLSVPESVSPVPGPDAFPVAIQAPPAATAKVAVATQSAAAAKVAAKAPVSVTSAASPTAPAVISPPPSAPMLVKPAKPASSSPGDVQVAAAKAKTKTAPQPLSPPPGSKPSIHQQAPLTSHVATAHITTAQLKMAPSPSESTSPASVKPMVRVPKAKRGLSNSAKTVLAAVLGILVVLLAWFLLDRHSRNKETELYNQMILLAAKDDTTEVPVNQHKLNILLNAATDVGGNQQRYIVYKALFHAKPTDGTDVDARILETALRAEIMPEIRIVLIRDVIRKRNNPKVVPTLVAYAADPATKPDGATAALEAVRYMSGDDQAEPFLDILKSSPHEIVRKAAEDTLHQLIKKSSSKEVLASKLVSTYKSSQDEHIRHAMIRLLGRCGGKQSLDLVTGVLNGSDPKDLPAAIASLGNWSDDEGFLALGKFLGENQDLALRARAFEALARFAANPPEGAKLGNDKHWELVTSNARTREEQLQAIRGLAQYRDDWAIRLLGPYKNASDDKVVDLANKAIDLIQQRQRAEGSK